MNPEMNTTPQTATEHVDVMTDEMAAKIEQEIEQTGVDNSSMTDVPNEPRMALEHASSEPSLEELLDSIAPGSEPTVTDPPMMITATEPPTAVAEEPSTTEAPRQKRKYTRRNTAAKREAAAQPRSEKRQRKAKRKVAVKAAMARRAAATEVEEQPRKRRKKLSPAVRKIETNVLRHVTREVRHTGVGWNPPILDPAWNDAVKRMEKDGLVVKREDMGGIVPKKLVGRFAALNNQVLAYVKNRFRQTGQGVTADRLLRARQAALIRLEKGGKVARTEHGYVPVDDLNAMEA